MTQREFDKLHREEKDQFGNTLRVGDYVLYSPYHRQVRIYRIAHFTSAGKCKADEIWPNKKNLERLSLYRKLGKTRS